jgi:hypothetical protein
MYVVKHLGVNPRRLLCFTLRLGFTETHGDTIGKHFTFLHSIVTFHSVLFPLKINFAGTGQPRKDIFTIQPLLNFVRKLRPKLIHRIDSRRGATAFESEKEDKRPDTWPTVAADVGRRRCQLGADFSARKEKSQKQHLQAFLSAYTFLSKSSMSERTRCQK